MFRGKGKPQFSIVTGTLNRVEHLKKMVASVRATVYPFSYEIVIADGGSKDNTIPWISEQRDIVLVEQKVRLGAVEAFNQCFLKSRGQYVVALNDDLVITGDIFDKAIEQFDKNPLVGQVAIPFMGPNDKEPKFDYVPIGSPQKKWRYANFAITPRWLGNEMGWWTGPMKHYGGDAHLSMKLWDAGYKVVDLEGNGYAIHYEEQDSTRQSNTDSPIFYDFWKDWKGPGRFPFAKKELSIVVASAGRIDGLKKLIESIEKFTQNIPYEIILVIPQSISLPIYISSKCRVLIEDEARGCVRAYNQGFMAAKGKYVVWLNDDCEVTVDWARNMIRSLGDENVLGAFYYRIPSRTVPFVNVIFGLTYANYGFIKRDLFEKLGFWSDEFQHYGADPDFSMRVWKRGYRVVGVPDAIIVHHETQDDIRNAHFRSPKPDKFMEKWKNDRPDKYAKIEDWIVRE